MKNYAYPFNLHWTHQEIADVVQFYNQVELVFESSSDFEEFDHAYRTFKQVVTSLSEEKQMDKLFEEASGYSLYQAVKLYKTMKKDHVNPNAKLRIRR